VLLEHTGHPDDPAGLHYDLLLEDAAACETWRLAEIPMIDGPSVDATPLPPHRLAWLDIESGEVSGGRGFTRRIAAGHYERLPQQPVASDPAAASTLIRLTGSPLAGILELRPEGTANLRPCEFVEG
jgi:hypothetical protein